MVLGEAGVAGFAGFLTSLGVPLAGVMAWVVVVIKVGAGAALILGYRAGLAAALLAVFTVFTILLVHNPLTQEDELTNALKNASIIGGLLYVIAYGPGAGWRIK
jgi:putative oxidoreductase